MPTRRSLAVLVAVSRAAALAALMSIPLAAHAQVAPTPRASRLARPGMPAASSATTRAITAADMRHRLFLIADDSMGGRATGSWGNYQAANYIAAECQRLGLRRM